jgi:hypothetical protein
MVQVFCYVPVCFTFKKFLRSERESAFFTGWVGLGVIMSNRAPALLSTAAAPLLVP